MNHQSNRSGPNVRLRHVALSALLALGAVGTAHAQLPYSAGNVVNTVGTYADLGTAGTAIATANTDDANSAATPIGFTFTYNGTAFTDFVLNTNGFLKLGTTAPTGAQYTDGGQSTINGPIDGADANLLLALNQDLTAGSGGGTEYRVYTTGTAPNRVCTIQWKNVSDKARAATASSAAVGTQYANISFQAKLYETSNQIDFVYGTATAGVPSADLPKFGIVGLKGTDAASTILGVKPSATPWSGTLFSAGAYIGNGHNFRGTRLPNPGQTYRFTIQVANDAAASAIQGYASVITPASNPFTLRGVVRNVGNNALTATTVTLTISGANTYTQTANVAALAVGTSAVATFSGISLPNVGQNTVTISVPSDGNNNNNSYLQAMETSATTVSLATPGAASGNNVFNAGTDGYYASKITLSAARSITAVSGLVSGTNTSTTATTSVGESVYGVVVDATTGTLLARSANYVITAADINTFHTFTLTAPATVPAGDVLIGVAQAAPTGALPFYPFGVQIEDPNRLDTYYSGSTTGGVPAAALNTATTSNYKFPFGAVTAAPANNDLAVNEIQGYGSIAVPVGNPFDLRAVVRNGGIAAVNTPTVVTLTIGGANTFTQTQTLTSLAVSATGTVTFSNISLPNVGANTVTVTIPNDDNNANNSVAQTMATSATRFSLIVPGVSVAGAYGPAAPTGTARTVAFCGRVAVNATRDVTAVRAFIYNDPNLVPNAANGQQSTTVYGVVVNATTGAVISRSADYVITAADLGQLHTFSLSANVPAGEFLAGMAIVTTAAITVGVFPMAYQSETPARPGRYYTVNITTPGAPFDAVTANARYMLEVETSAPNTCPTPTGLAITGNTSTSASFSFTAAASATGYQLIYGAQGFTPGGAGSTTSPTFTGTTYTLAGLSASTTYDFYIQTICSATSQSGLGGPVRLTTACTPPTIAAFPYAQTFDVVAANQALPCGITVTDVNNDGFTWRATGTVVDPATTNVARSAPNAMVYSYNNQGPTPTVAANDWFFTPALSLVTTQRYRVSFYYRVASGGYTEGLEVKYGPAATPAGQTSLLYTNAALTSAAYLLVNNATTPAVLDLAPASAGNYYVGFHAISQANQGFLAVDDLNISAGPLATSEALKRAVSVFPNPSNTGVFNLEIHGANARQALSVEVTNTLGQRVYTGSAKDNFNNSVNLSSLASGIYSIKVRNGEEYTQQQISIVK